MSSEHHTHHHHHHHHIQNHFGRAFAIGIIANALYLVGEIIVGFYSHSMALIADGEHNFSDVLALGASWLAHSLTQREPTSHFTYGLGRSSILITVANTFILMLVTGGVILESCQRLFYPQTVTPDPIMITAALGIVVNGGTALLFISGSKGDLNIKSAFIHLASDACIAGSVLLSGFLVYLFHQAWIDPCVSLIISLLIIKSAWSILKESLDLALDGVPHNISTGEVSNFLLSFPAITAIHDLHIWPLSTTQTALTVHLVCSKEDAHSHLHIRDDIVKALRDRFGIAHPTLQIEIVDCGTNCQLKHQTKHS